jgi:hypothetical protein
MTVQANCKVPSANRIVLNGIMDDRAAQLLVDYSATFVFVNEGFVTPAQTQLLPQARRLALGDNEEAAPIPKWAVFDELMLGDHSERLPAYVTKLEYDIVLGYSWLEKHNPSIDWVTRQIRFDSCEGKCSSGKTTIPYTFASNTPKVSHISAVEACAAMRARGEGY